MRTWKDTSADALFPALGATVPAMMKAEAGGSRNSTFLNYLKKNHRNTLRDVAFLEIKIFAHQEGGRSWYLVVAPREVGPYQNIVRNLVNPDDESGRTYGIGKNYDFLESDQVVIIPISPTFAGNEDEAAGEWTAASYDLDEMSAGEQLKEAPLNAALDYFQALFNEADPPLRTGAGAPLAAVVCCNLRAASGEVVRPVSQIFVGVGANLLTKAKIPRLNRHGKLFLADIMLLIYRNLAAPVGKRTQKMEFAHQTSRVTDAIAEMIQRLSEDVRNKLGLHLITQFHLLRAVVNSYREKATRVDPGFFPVAWAANENPVPTYRDIAILLGLARCEDAPQDEKDVRKAGRAGRLPSNDIGTPGFNIYRELVHLPQNLQPWMLPYLKHSDFAVLFSLALSQAFYHMVRSRLKRLVAKPEAIVTVRFEINKVARKFRCVIENPPATSVVETGGSLGRPSKDVEELRSLSAALSADPNLLAGTSAKAGRGMYNTEGPTFVSEVGRWRTILTCEAADGR